MECEDTSARFAISGPEQIRSVDVEMHLTALVEASSPNMPRQSMPDSEWMAELALCLTRLIDLRVTHVRTWLDCNLERFQGSNAAIGDLHRRFDNMVIEMNTNVQLCRAQCVSCHLLCVRGRLHEGEHNCKTDHKCAHTCEFSGCGSDIKACGTPYV